MSEERERTQTILLRILGVILIAVGFSILANQVRSESAYPIRIVERITTGHSNDAEKCDRRVVHTRKVNVPAPPAPPVPPVPPRLSF